MSSKCGKCGNYYSGHLCQSCEQLKVMRQEGERNRALLDRQHKENKWRERDEDRRRREEDDQRKSESRDEDRRRREEDDQRESESRNRENAEIDRENDRENARIDRENAKIDRQNQKYREYKDQQKLNRILAKMVLIVDDDKKTERDSAREIKDLFRKNDRLIFEDQDSFDFLVEQISLLVMESSIESRRRISSSIAAIEEMNVEHLQRIEKTASDIKVKAEVVAREVAKKAEASAQEAEKKEEKHKKVEMELAKHDKTTRDKFACSHCIYYGRMIIKKNKPNAILLMLSIITLTYSSKSMVLQCPSCNGEVTIE